MNRKFTTSALIALSLMLFLCVISPSASGGTKTLAFLPLEIFADESKSYLREGLTSMFISRLSGGDIDIMDNETIESALNPDDRNGIRSRERAEELANVLSVDYALFGSITSLGEGYSLDLSVLDMTGKKPRLTRISEAVDEAQLITRLSDVVYQLRAAIDGIDLRGQGKAGIGAFSSRGESSKGLFFKPTDEYYSFKPSGSLPIRMAVMAFASGDLDGDGETELVVVSRDRVMVYFRKEGRFVQKDNLKPSFGRQFLKVSVGDADENGKEEICLVSLDGTRAVSTVWEWSGTFKKLFSMSGHLQIVAVQDTVKPVVLFQDTKMNSFYYGDIWVMGYDKMGKLQRVEVLKTPEEAQFYSLTFFDLNGDGDTEILGLGESGLKERARLTVWSRDGEALWSSDEKYGGTNNVVQVDRTGYKDDEPPRIPLNCRPVIIDIDGDGDNEVLVVKNIPIVDFLTNFKTFIKSKLTAFSIEGVSLTPSLTTREIKYCTVDIQTEDESLFLAAQKPKVLKFETGSGRVLWFE